MIYPPKPQPGDRVAVLSPSNGNPSRFPHVYGLGRPNTPEQKRVYAEEQRAAVLRAVRKYAPHATVVFDLDFGHTDPNLIIPYGGDIRIDGPARTISVRY